MNTARVPTSRASEDALRSGRITSRWVSTPSTVEPSTPHATAGQYGTPWLTASSHCT